MRIRELETVGGQLRSNRQTALFAKIGTTSSTRPSKQTENELLTRTTTGEKERALRMLPACLQSGIEAVASVLLSTYKYLSMPRPLES